MFGVRIFLVLSLAVVSSASTHSDLLNIAFDAIARASTSSQVLSLDLTSVILLLVLKLIIAFIQWVNGVASARSLSISLSGLGQAGGLCVVKYSLGAEDEDMLECFTR